MWELGAGAGGGREDYDLEGGRVVVVVVVAVVVVVMAVVSR